MIGLFLLAFIAGIFTLLAPCTLPLLPAYLALATAPSKTRAVFRTIAFGAGVALVFTLLGVLAGSFGSLIGTHKDVIARVAGALFVVFGVLIIMGRGLPALRIDTRTKSTLGGTFLYGVLFAIAWSGCIGPIVGFALVLAAQTQTAVLGGALLFTYAIGLLVPLIAISATLDKLKGTRALAFLRGKEIMIGGRAYHTTQLVTGALLIIVGIIFLTRADLFLARSPIIGWIFTLEERIADSFNITLSIPR
jgi:cytochrome c-type biogenesis protein